MVSLRQQQHMLTEIHSYMTSIPNSFLDEAVQGVSMIYHCPKDKNPPPPDSGVADIKLIIQGPKKISSLIQDFGGPLTVTVYNPVDVPVTNFTVPNVGFNWAYVNKTDGTGVAPALTYLHCK